MKVYVLSDNHAGGNTMAEHGLSYLIENQGVKIMFDAGQSPLFINNAKRMGVELDDVDVKVLSHGHFDHGDGFKHFPGGKLYCHPGCFTKRYRKTDKSYIGLNLPYEDFNRQFEVHTSARATELSKGIFFLGEIPRVMDFESKTTSFVFESGDPDFVKDDSGIALVLTDGLFVITGCGHAGLVNTLEHAMKITGVKKIVGVMGGFHLKSLNNQTKSTLAYLKKIKPMYVYPSHCTELPVLAEFYNEFGFEQVKTGMILDFK